MTSLTGYRPGSSSWIRELSLYLLFCITMKRRITDSLHKIPWFMDRQATVPSLQLRPLRWCQVLTVSVFFSTYIYYYCLTSFLTKINASIRQIGTITAMTTQKRNHGNKVQRTPVYQHTSLLLPRSERSIPHIHVTLMDTTPRTI
jgi:hypothetical protein